MTDEREIDAPDLPSLMRYSAARGSNLERPLADVEAEHIRNVLEFAEGNKTRAAEIFGIDPVNTRSKTRTLVNSRLLIAIMAPLQGGHNR